MSVEQNKVLVKRFYDEAVNEGNLELINELVAENFIEHEVFPGLSEGRDGLTQFLSMMHDAFSGFRMEVEDLIAEADKVVARITMKGTHTGEFMEISATGKTVAVSTIDIVRLANGKASEHWGVTDATTMMEQLGAR